jgi:haloacetate dehalogenase
MLNRRDWLKQVAAASAAASVAAGTGRALEGQTVSDTTRFFPGFKGFRVQTSGAVINGVIGGQGPPILLLHGAPQSHISWRRVAPALAATHTVVVPDLRGYGDSSKPPDGENHANYSKRAMALDQVEVMRHFGFDTFPAIGHDRGARVTHRMALDHPERVTHAAVLDIVPTHYLYTNFKIQFVQRYFHWFSYLRPSPIPENELKAQNDARRARTTDEVQLEYLRTASDQANIHAMCEDYRASASIDLAHDEADMQQKITCPLLVLWGAKGAYPGLYDVLAIWRERGTKVFGKELPAGHNLQEDVPDLVLAEIQGLLRTSA